MFGVQFYPTPIEVAKKMIEPYLCETKHNSRYLKGDRFLDPSAGSGDLLEVMRGFAGEYCRQDRFFAIEIDPELRLILQGKKFQVVHSDFLTYDEHGKFDLIAMNPPFAEGAEHVLKAWDYLDDGGDLVALVNWQTLTNLSDKKRILLDRLIEAHGSKENIGCAFKNADRQTDVEIGLVRLAKPKRDDKVNFDHIEFGSDDPVEGQAFEANPLANSNYLDSLVAQYNTLHALLIQRDRDSKKFLFYTQGLKESHTDVFSKIRGEDLDRQLAELKSILWETVFQKAKIAQRVTGTFKRDFNTYQKAQELMSFSVANIREMLMQFIGNYDEIMLKCLVEVFDNVTKYHKLNQVHTEGWVTNKGYRLNKKIIYPHGVRFDGRWSQPEFDVQDPSFLADLDKILCWIEGSQYENLANPTAATLERHCKAVKCDGFDYNTEIESTYFKMKMFKKGTLHAIFKDQKLLNEFNLRAAKGKNWIGGDGY